MKFTEAQLEQAFISLLQEEKMTHLVGGEVRKIEYNGAAEPPTVYGHIVSKQVLLTEDLKNYLRSAYATENITENEIESIVRDLDRLPSSDLYESNKTFMKLVCDGFLLKREDYTQKDLYIQLIDYEALDNNRFRIVNQMEIQGFELRIPDGIL